MTKLVYHPIAILLITALVLGFFISLNESSQKTQKSSENIRVLEHEVNQISTEVMELEENIARTQSITFREKMIRNELLLQKKGEYIIQLPNFEEKKDIDEATQEGKKTLDQWVELFTY